MIDPHMERLRQLRDRLAFAAIGSEWYPHDGVAIAVDAAPSEPQIETVEMPAWLQPDPASLAETSLIATFYNGVPHAVGAARHEEYIRAKAMSHA
jgi:hypothetical protein